jgi:hypothetical protein
VRPHRALPTAEGLGGFANLTKFLIKNPANILLALLSGIFAIACPLTWQDIPDNSRVVHQFY